MGSQDQNRYNDPTAHVEAYSIEYLKSLRAAGQNEEISRLYGLGHFTEAIAEEAAAKKVNRTYSRQKGISQAGSIKGLEEKQEADRAANEAITEARRKEALAQLRRLGVNPEDLR